MADEGWLARLRTLVHGKRVVPPDPPGCSQSGPERDDEQPPEQPRPDQTASWSTHISYVDAKGDRSDRKITFRRISGPFGHPQTIHAWCHMREQTRSFTIANIREMHCASTGEVLDPLENCIALHRNGALKIEDSVLTRLMRILVFMAKCDGDFHSLERNELDEMLGRYFRFFGGDDTAYECASKEAPRLAPDGDQFLRDLRWLKTTPPREQRSQLARFTLESCASIIAADGRQAPEEFTWGMEVSDALKRMAGGGSTR